MIPPRPSGQVFNIVAVVQSGRLQYEALLLAASLRARSPHLEGKLYLAEPQRGPLWRRDPAVTDPAVREMLQELGAEFLPFEPAIFGEKYPYGNKIETLAYLPDAPFLFLDTDTLILGDIGQVPFDFARPSASMRREGTWPLMQPYLTYDQVWGALYARFGLDFDRSLDRSQPADYWQRYLYFNAGWFFGQSPRQFGARFATYAQSIRDNPLPELAAQELYPWLDQIALPLVIHSLGGGRPGPELSGMDGDITCHYRNLALLYARESDLAVEVLEEVAKDQPLRKLLRDHEPIKLMVYQNKGRKARELFDRNDLPRREQMLRGPLKAAGLWLR